jgi:pimeloyl-ACP methyl ester carboxylesterase
VSACCWINQLVGLAGALPVFAVDLPGHGESDPSDAASVEKSAEVLGAVLDALATGPVIAAGHSLAGDSTPTGFGLS